MVLNVAAQCSGTMADRILSRSLQRRTESATASSDDADEDLSIALLFLVTPSYATKNVMVVASHHAFGHYPFADPFLHELLSFRSPDKAQWLTHRCRQSALFLIFSPFYPLQPSTVGTSPVPGQRTVLKRLKLSATIHPHADE
jgi:hypothetical protein